MKRIAGIFLSIAAFAYTIRYMHFATPYKNSGALSKIGLEHHGLFIIWGVLTFSALAYNLIIAYKRYTKSRLYIPMLAVAFVGMVMTLCFDFDYDKKPDYYFHCGGSLAFSIIMGITVFFLFALCFKKALLFKVMTIITAGILIVDLICLLIFKENALIEVLPVFAGYIMLGIVNTRRDKVEIKQ